MACRKAPRYVAIKSIRRAMIFYWSKVNLSPSNPVCSPRPGLFVSLLEIHANDDEKEEDRRGELLINII